MAQSDPITSIQGIDPISLTRSIDQKMFCLGFCIELFAISKNILKILFLFDKRIIFPILHQSIENIRKIPQNHPNFFYWISFST